MQKETLDYINKELHT